MAEHLARIIGTEEDRVNCPFYWKIGACRHGDQCSRSHYKPTSSQTLVLRHMYRNPPIAIAIAEAAKMEMRDIRLIVSPYYSTGQDMDNTLADRAQDHFEAFYEEVFEELANYGQIEEMVVCDNIGDHMIGNLYVKYVSEDDAEKAATQLKGRYYSGRMIEVEFSPVTDFREARCRQFVDGQCTRGGYCNFMHMKHVPRALKRKMVDRMLSEHRDYKATPSMYREDPSRGGRRYDRQNRYNNSHSDTKRYGRSRDSPNAPSTRNSNKTSSNHYRESSYSKRYESPRRETRRRRSHSDGHSRYHQSLPRYEKPSRRRQSSQERRAMIAQWNKEADEEADHNKSNAPSE